VETLRRAVADGTIDAIQSGHMPRSREKKMDDLDIAPHGAASLETTLATIITFMINEDVLDWPTAIERLSSAPARIAGIEGGTLAKTAPADVIVIDPEASWTVDGNQFRSRCNSSPLDGWTLKGKVTHTIVGGIIRFQEQVAAMA
jgi:dihydroorotase